jgi:ArsR family transcriptional regulator
VKHVTESCCGTKKNKDAGEREIEIPEQIQRELDELGGFEALAGRIPSTTKLVEKSRVYHALSDPLRLTILYLLRDQPLCVCVINRFMHLAGSKLSYHLNILKESGLIEGEYHGNWIIYRITNTGRRYLKCTEGISAFTGNIL